MDDAQLRSLTLRVRAITKPRPQLLWYYALVSLVALCAFPVLFVPLFFRYETLWYRFDEQGVAMGYGLLFRREVQLTYARMQDIHLSQNLLERWLGIGTVTVQTAGAGAQGHLAIVGVRDFEAVRDFLYARMRGVHRDGADGAAGGASAEQLLGDIRGSLERAAQALERAAGGPLP